VVDFVTLFNNLNLSPVNTLLLAALGFFLKNIIDRFEERIAVVEELTGCHAKSIAWIKGHLDIEEEQ